MNQSKIKWFRQGTALASASLGMIAGAAQAQSTSISLFAQPSATTLSAGDTLNLLFSLNVNSLAAGDNFTSASFFLAYANSPTGSAAPVSPFSSISVTPIVGGASLNSVFSNVTLSQAAATGTLGGSQLIGVNVRQGATTTRTNTGTFQLAQATAVLRSDLAPGNYTFNFADNGSGLVRTFVAGNFSGAGNISVSNGQLTTNSVKITVRAAAVPEPSLVAGMALGGALFGGNLLSRRRKRAGKSEWNGTIESGAV